MPQIGFDKWMRSLKCFLFRRSIRRGFYLAESGPVWAYLWKLRKSWVLAHKHSCEERSLCFCGWQRQRAGPYSLEPRAEWLSPWGASISRKLHAVKVRSQFAGSQDVASPTHPNVLPRRPTVSRSGRLSLVLSHLETGKQNPKPRKPQLFLPHPT